MSPLEKVDALILAGAVLQCVLVLRSRRFRAQDWLLPLVILIGGSLGFYGFLRICSSDISIVADVVVIGFAMALVGTGLFVAESAPARLNPTALLSLTITFWAAYAAGSMSRAWLFPALGMTVVTVLFAFGRGAALVPLRMLLHAWSLLIGAALAADGVPAQVATFYSGYQKAEQASTLIPLEVFMAGAQAFLLIQMACGLLLLFDGNTWSAWAPSSRDERPGAAAVVALLAQGVLFVWLRQAGHGDPGGLLAVSAFVVLAHGAMTGADATNADPVPAVDPRDELLLSPQERMFFDELRQDALDFLVRRRLIPAAATVACAAAFYFSRA